MRKKLERPTVEYGQIVEARDGRMRRYLGPVKGEDHLYEMISPRRRMSMGYTNRVYSLLKGAGVEVTDGIDPDYLGICWISTWDTFTAGGRVLDEDEMKVRRLPMIVKEEP